VVLLGPEKPKAEEETVIPGLSPPPITITARQAAVIEGLARSKSKEYRLVQRANMIIEMAAGKNNEEVARPTNSNRLSVRLWRRRWLEATKRLELAEKQGVEEQLLTNIIEDILSDKYRSGTPPKFTPEQIVQIVAISCEKPEDSGRPISHWTARELAQEAIKRQIVESISTRSAGRFLKGDGITTPSGGVLVKGQA
jgi:putative transposase